MDEKKRERTINYNTHAYNMCSIYWFIIYCVRACFTLVCEVCVCIYKNKKSIITKVFVSLRFVVQYYRVYLMY